MISESFIINGRKPLSGEIEVRGCKNAATPIIAATLLTKEPCYIKNLPLIEDVFRMIEIIKGLGAKVEFVGKREIRIEARNINPLKIEKKLIKMLRSSVLVLGPLIARFKKINLLQPGGCLIGARPIDAHIKGLIQMGAEVEKNKKKYSFKTKGLKPNEIILPEFSVTATENILMAASLIEGKTILKIAALEPQVKDLSSVLIKMGARIEWKEDHSVEIIGRKKLKGFSHFLIYDPIEAASFIILAGAVGQFSKKNTKIEIKNVPFESLDLSIQKIKEFGIRMEKEGNNIIVFPSKKLSSPGKIQNLPYPGIPADLQCLFGTLATQAKGKTLIHDPMYEGRLRYLESLNKMGARITILDLHRAIIEGPSNLKGLKVENYDLRSGIALIIAGLVAKGKTIISSAYQVDRGYEKIEERLRNLGAAIERKKDKLITEPNSS